MEMHIIKSKEEFENYKVSLYRSEWSRHNGEPEKFPCLVLFQFYDNPNGRDWYDYDFIYVEDALELIKAQKEIYDKEPEKALEE